jgi:hypothetical protein
LNWDILFLLPVPWWGPVLAPVLISLLMIFWGTFTTQSSENFEHPPALLLSNWRVWALNFAGVVLALYVFMADTLAAVPRGLEAVCSVLPEKFNWPLFLAALVLMAAPVIRTGWQCLTRQQVQPKISRTMQDLDASTT